MKDTFQQGCKLAPPLPGTFPGVMEMYEANYIRIRKLCGAKESMPAVAVSQISMGMDLYLQVLEQTKYTTTIALTYYFADPEYGFLAYPDLKIRIYFDALQAEVMSLSCRWQSPNFTTFKHEMGQSLVKHWRMNRFLYKWLSFCDRQGHSFQAGDKSRQNHLLTKNVEIPLRGSSTSSTIVQ